MRVECNHVPEGTDELGVADDVLDHVGAEICDVREAGELDFSGIVFFLALRCPGSGTKPDAILYRVI